MKKCWFIFNGPIDEFYTYRRSKVAPSLVVELSLMEERDLKQSLSELGYSLENHVVWRSNGVYYQYSDHKLLVGGVLLYVYE